MHFREPAHQQLVTRGLVRSALDLPARSRARRLAFRKRRARASGASRVRRRRARHLHFNLAHTRRPGGHGGGARRGASASMSSAPTRRAPLAVARRYFSAAESRCARGPAGGRAAAAIPAAVDAQGGLSEGHWHRHRGWPGQHDVQFDDRTRVRFERAAIRRRRAGCFSEFDVDGGYLLALAHLSITTMRAPRSSVACGVSGGASVSAPVSSPARRLRSGTARPGLTKWRSRCSR